MRRASQAKGASAFLLRRSAAAGKLGNRILAAPNRIITTTTQTFLGLSTFGLQAAVLVALLLLLFVVHSLFVWDERTPEQAFDRSASLLEAVEIGYDTTTILLNGVTDVANSFVIPAWNGAVYYAVEPSVFLLLEAFSIVFEGHEYQGVLDEAEFEYRGLDCLSTPESARFCGRYRSYENLLIQNEQGFANESQVFLGIATARRLSELSGEFRAPVFDLSSVTDVLTHVLTLGITSLAPLADIFASVLDDVIETSARTVFDSLWFLAENLAMTLKMVVNSGLLTFLVTVGVDFLIIYYVYYALPMFLATIDFISCVIQLILPSTWPEQLRCAELKCFTGPEAASDLLIFTSYSRYAGLISDALDAMVNGATARTFGSGIETGVMGGFLGNSVVGIAEAMRNIAGAFDVPASAEECAACFKCRYPEMRAVWLIVASVFSIGSPSSYRRFSGNVTENCVDNATFYQAVCGPRGAGAENLNFVTWKNAFRTGWDPYDPDLIEEYAGLFAKRADELGGASSYAGGLLQIAADSWFLRDITAGEEEAAPFVYHACKLMRSSDGGETTDIGPGFSYYPQGSLSHVSGGFLYSLCKRFRHTTVGFGRDIHDIVHEALACVGDPVGCV